MIAHRSQQVFESLLSDAGLSLQELGVSQGFELMFQFYRQLRAEDCLPEDDGDMLLFQWGMRRQSDGELFELDLIRQFIIDGEADDEGIWQLSLTFKFRPTDELRRLVSGNKWCPEPGDRAVDHFERFVRESLAYRVASAAQSVKAELNYLNAG